jgi:hypothetical protein
MEPGSTQPAAPAGTERLNFPYLVIIGAAMGLVAPFTVFAWPVAILVGMVTGRAAVERSQGVQQRGAVHLLRALVIVGGIIAMLWLGAVIGGFIALLVAGLASFSERITANAGPTDQMVGRILLVVLTAVIWAGLFLGLGLKLSLSIG